MTLYVDFLYTHRVQHHHLHYHCRLVAIADAIVIHVVVGIYQW